MARSLQEWADDGYYVGATVEQSIGGFSRKDRATITHVDVSGALDVEINGRAYGWSASRCTPVQRAES